MGAHHSKRKSPQGKRSGSFQKPTSQHVGLTEPGLGPYQENIGTYGYATLPQPEKASSSTWGSNSQRHRRKKRAPVVPSNISLQPVTITKDLQTRLLKHPRYTAVPFSCNVQRGTSFHTGANVPLSFLSDPDHWNAIKIHLTNVGRLNPEQHSALSIVQDAILSYSLNASHLTNFQVLRHPDIHQILSHILPFIAEQALLLPVLLQQPIPVLQRSESKTIFLTRQVCLSLLANAFFCTFPGHDLRDMPDFNFLRLFNDNDAERSQCKKEKLKCILNYFNTMKTQTGNTPFLHQIISFERRCVTKKAHWEKSTKPLCPVAIEPTKKIEEASNMLQVDFADKIVGGGVMNNGCLMEEIRFSICSELLVARLFSQSLGADEVVAVTGAEMYSFYKGYSNTFVFDGPVQKAWGHQPTDNLGRTFLQTVTMNATRYKQHEQWKQFDPYYINRDLHKCKVAFMHGKVQINPVATGNWGCGAFNGNKQLKFVIQWLAASYSNRPSIHYHVVGDLSQAKELTELSNFLQEKNATISQLYLIISNYATDVSNMPNQSMDLFEYIRYRYNASSHVE